MKYGLQWFNVKQLRFSQRLYGWIFNLSLSIHIFKKYHKFNPSVPEIMAAQHGGKLYKYQIEKLKWNGMEIPDKLKIKEEKFTEIDSETSTRKRLLLLVMMAKDVESGQLDYYPALKEEIISRIEVGTSQLAKDLLKE